MPRLFGEICCGITLAIILPITFTIISALSLISTKYLEYLLFSLKMACILFLSFIFYKMHLFTIWLMKLLVWCTNKLSLTANLRILSMEIFRCCGLLCAYFGLIAILYKNIWNCEVRFEYWYIRYPMVALLIDTISLGIYFIPNNQGDIRWNYLESLFSVSVGYSIFVYLCI